VSCRLTERGIRGSARGKHGILGDHIIYQYQRYAELFSIVMPLKCSKPRFTLYNTPLSSTNGRRAIYYLCLSPSSPRYRTSPPPLLARTLQFVVFKGHLSAATCYRDYWVKFSTLGLKTAERALGSYNYIRPCQSSGETQALRAR
jgi:hypothetical protein